MRPNGGYPRAVSRSPTAKAEERGEERKERREGSRKGHGGTVRKCWKLGTRYCCVSYVGREGRRKIWGVKGGREIIEEFGRNGGTKEREN